MMTFAPLIWGCDEADVMGSIGRGSYPRSDGVSEMTGQSP